MADDDEQPERSGREEMRTTPTSSGRWGARNDKTLPIEKWLQKWQRENGNRPLSVSDAEAIGLALLAEFDVA